MKEFWNSRYSEAEFAYGARPNDFVREQLPPLGKGRVLFPAEGEGRNAVFAALTGFEVFAFDISVEGKKKAHELASKSEVAIDYRIEAFEVVDYPQGYFDAIVLVFAHMPADKRRDWHRRLTGFLRPGGRIILEGFAKAQIGYSSGGPPVVDMLFSEDELTGDFKDFKIEFLNTSHRKLNEGLYHQGEAVTVQAVFVK